MTNDKSRVTIYGTSWCGSSRRAKIFFEEHMIDFEWVDIDKDDAAAQYVMSVNNGNRSVPTILFPDGSILVEPSGYQLKEKTGISD